MPLPNFDDQGHDLQIFIEEHSRNGAKIVILLEELQLHYKIHTVTHPKEDPHHPVEHGYGRVPAVTVLTEEDPEEGKVHIHESGHIMQYLVAHYDKNHHFSYPAGSKEAVEVNNWLFFQVGKIGPSHEEAEHFSRNAPEKLQYPIEHFIGKARALYLTLDKHLAKTNHPFLVGNKLTIADIALYPWVEAAAKTGLDVEDFSHLTAWESRLATRAAVKKGMEHA